MFDYETEYMDIPAKIQTALCIMNMSEGRDVNQLTGAAMDLLMKYLTEKEEANV